MWEENIFCKEVCVISGIYINYLVDKLYRVENELIVYNVNVVVKGKGCDALKYIKRNPNGDEKLLTISNFTLQC